MFADDVRIARAIDNNNDIRAMQLTINQLPIDNISNLCNENDLHLNLG